MFVFGEIAKKLTKQKIIEYAATVFNYEFVKDEIIRILQTRLYKDGETASGKELQTNSALFQKTSYYSNLTKQIKSSKGQKTSNVTLKDTGEFYESFKVIAAKTFYNVYANFNKPDGNIYENFTKSFNTFEEFSNEILKMNDEELRFFYDKIFIPEFKSVLLYNILKDV